MKPNSTNNLSFLGWLGLIILFNLPYIGTPATILFAIFGKGSARTLARVFLLITVIIVGLSLALSLLGFINFEQFIPTTNIGDVQALLNVPGFLA